MIVVIVALRYTTISLHSPHDALLLQYYLWQRCIGRQNKWFVRVTMIAQIAEVEVEIIVDE